MSQCALSSSSGLPIHWRCSWPISLLLSCTLTSLLPCNSFQHLFSIGVAIHQSKTFVNIHRSIPDRLASKTPHLCLVLIDCRFYNSNIHIVPHYCTGTPSPSNLSRLPLSTSNQATWGEWGARSSTRWYGLRVP